jgi:hypothetical protein
MWHRVEVVLTDVSEERIASIFRVEGKIRKSAHEASVRDVKSRLVTGCWRKLHNEELHNLYSSPSIIRMIKSRRIRWAGHLARMEARAMHVRYWWESQKERDHWEDAYVSGWIILNGS